MLRKTISGAFGAQIGLERMGRRAVAHRCDEAAAADDAAVLHAGGESDSETDTTVVVRPGPNMKATTIKTRGRFGCGS